MRRIKFLLFSSALLVAACKEDAYDVTPESIAARVAELGAHLERALAEERAFVAARTFEDVGLATFGGDEDFEQDFTVFARRTESVSVRLGGVPVPAGRVAASLSSERISWTEQDSVSFVSVGPESDPMNAWMIWRGATGKILFLVDASHGDRFGDMARRMAEPVTGLHIPEGRDMVAVLAPEGLDVPSQGGVVPPFRVEALARTETRARSNVVGLLPGRRSDEIVVFSASRDHVSGTAAVLELARYYASRDRPERTLVFVSYAERSSAPGPNDDFGPPDDFGAQHFSLSVNPANVVALLHVDRIGEPNPDGNADGMATSAWITGYDRSTLAGLLQASNGDSLQPSFGPDPYPWFNLFELLGNAPMAARGVVAHAVGTSPVAETGTWYPDMNAPERLDPAHMAQVTWSIIRGMQLILDAETTPNRLKPQ